MTISAILSTKGTDVATVSVGTTVRDAVSLLAERRIGAVPVIGSSGISGIFSERDLVRCVSEYGGESGDWAKMTTRTRVVGGTPISVHWYENVTSGLRVEFKTPINR